MHVDLPPALLRSLAWIQRRWWKIRRPVTFGVKALLVLPDGRFLAVRHSYGDTARWGLPGGGYRPGREGPDAAAAREVWEELRIAMAPEDFTVLDRAMTTLEGKRDTVTILSAVAPTDQVQLAPELAEARWFGHVGELGPVPVSRWLRVALARVDRT